MTDAAPTFRAHTNPLFAWPTKGVVGRGKWFCRTFRDAVRTAVMAWAVSGQCCCRVLLPSLSPVIIDSIAGVSGGVVIAAHPRARGSRCRRCGRVSTRVHSRYRRHLADLPCHWSQ